MRSINPERVSFQQPEPMDESSVVDQEMLEVSVHLTLPSIENLAQAAKARVF